MEQATETLPAEGGRYIRNPDGTLTRIEEAAQPLDNQAAPPAADPA